MNNHDIVFFAGILVLGDNIHPRIYEEDICIFRGNAKRTFSISREKIGIVQLL